MRYFLDTEFFETPGEIVMISIGIVAEDGRTLYLENADFPREIYATTEGEWLRENVWPGLRWYDKEDRFTSHIVRQDAPNSVEGLTDTTTMATLIKEFVLGEPDDGSDLEFWAYYADYDWVVFCWLFGRMIDLPEGFPMFCHDIKQVLYEHNLHVGKELKDGANHNALDDARNNLEMYIWMQGQIQRMQMSAPPEYTHPEGAAEACSNWLGKEGLDFFANVFRTHGRLNVVLTVGNIPHPVHLREGMDVRNWMRKSGFYTDVHKDDPREDIIECGWESLVTAAIAKAAYKLDEEDTEDAEEEFKEAEYDVRICRDSSRQQVVTLTAKSREAAEEEAMRIAGDQDFSGFIEFAVEYRVVG